MGNRVVINMEDSGALVTVAMLSTLLQNRQKDYLDVISPFILNLVPKSVGERINCTEIIRQLSDQYGFEQFPINVLTKVLNRYTKLKYGLLEKQAGSFFVKKIYEDASFEEKQATIRKAHNKVMEELRTYLIKNSKYTKITIEKTRELFLSFLEKNGLNFVDGIEKLRAIRASDFDVYQVARFVLQEYDKKTDTFHQIEEVVRGFFVYKTIYFYGKFDYIPQTSKLKGTVVVLDTALLIEVLGYNTDEGAIAVRELVNLIIQNGGTVKTFSHLISELKGILTAFARDLSSRSTFSLHNLYEKKYTETDVIRLRDALEINLSKKYIEVIDPILSEDLDTESFTALRPGELAVSIQKTYSLSIANKRSENDVLSVASVFHMRDNSRGCSIENCKAIIVTTNLGFLAAVNDLYGDSHNDNVGFVISDIDLTAILWLQSWDKKSSLPTIILLENAYSACQPTQPLVAAFTSTIEKLRQEGTISDDEALLLRTQPAPMEDLIESSQNDVSSVNESLVIQIQERYVRSLTEEKDKEIAELKRKIRERQDKQRQRRLKALEHADTIASRAAAKFERKLKGIVIVIAAILILLGSVAICFSIFNNSISLFWKILLIVIGIFSLFQLLWAGKGFISKAILKAKNNRFNKVHDIEVTRLDKEAMDE